MVRSPVAKLSLASFLAFLKGFSSVRNNQDSELRIIFHLLDERH
jgi:hypothetical protein